MARPLRLGWISTYNARCGIAKYSAHLLEFFDRHEFDITILADNQETVGPDPDNVVRLWSNASGLPRVTEYLRANRFDAAVFQHNFCFFDFGEFADALTSLSDAAIATFLVLHRTKKIEDHQQLIRALHRCTRIFVHSLEDVNRLSELSVSENVTLLAHGVIDRTPLNSNAVRGLLGLSSCRPVIGSFGFMLPGKGLPELIHAFALLLKAYPNAFLLLANADYPVVESPGERERCRALIRLLEIEDRVRLVSDFLEADETLFLLSACDAIVYPYQHAQDSASGAVRLGLAAGRPVVTTPLSHFADLDDVVHRLAGSGVADIVEGVIALLRDNECQAATIRRQREWVHANSWAIQASRIANIVRSSFEEKHGVAWRRPAAADERLEQSPAVGLTIDTKATAGAHDGAVIVDRPPLVAAGLLPPIKRWKKFLRSIGVPALNGDRRHAGRRAMARADRARDRRAWTAAARYYRAALDLQPDNPAAWVQYGHALKESGNVSAGEIAYRRSIALDGNVADTHLQLGHALKLQGRKIEASVAYLHALVLDPALDDAPVELRALGWSRARIALNLRRERSMKADRFASLTEARP
jgi:glycosyltransferase involved in cell wall biosynthesis